MKRLNKVRETNLKMNSQVFKMRRAVLDILYHIKTFYPDMPRVEIRIVQDNGLILGRASYGVRHISIMQRTLSQPYFAEVVYHELVHTLFAVKHDETCRLMKSQIDSKDKILSRNELDKLFKQYLNKNKESH